MKIKISYIELFLYTILAGFTINFVGSISISEIYILLISPFIIKKIDFVRYPELKTILKIYLVYFFVQIISEIANQSEITNWTRGLSVTIVSALTFLYLFQKYVEDQFLIIIVLLGILLKNYLFPGVEIDFNNENEQMSFFKFYLSPILTSLSLIISYFLLKRGNFKSVFILFYLIGVFFVANDARSVGITTIFVALILQFGERISQKKAIILPGVIFLLTLFYIAYLSYTYAVLNKIVGGAHSYNQFTRIENPYNPLELLKTGRAETFVAIEAIKDAPFFGHGTWAKDKDGKYHRMVMELHKQDQLNQHIKNRIKIGGNKAVIPSHSVILGVGVYYGIIATIIIISLVIFFLKKGVEGIDFSSPYAAILIKTILVLIWASMFSPVTSFKNSIPMALATLLTLYTVKKQTIFNPSNLNQLR